MHPAFKYVLSIRCVARFNALFNNEQNVQVSDTMKMIKELKAGNKKYLHISTKSL